jgi:hypothetical protein
MPHPNFKQLVITHFMINIWTGYNSYEEKNKFCTTNSIVKYKGLENNVKFTQSL